MWNVAKEAAPSHQRLHSMRANVNHHTGLPTAKKVLFLVFNYVFHGYLIYSSVFFFFGTQPLPAGLILASMVALAWRVANAPASSVPALKATAEASAKLVKPPLSTQNTQSTLLKLCHHYFLFRLEGQTTVTKRMESFTVVWWAWRLKAKSVWTGIPTSSCRKAATRSSSMLALMELGHTITAGERSSRGNIAHADIKTSALSCYTDISLNKMWTKGCFYVFFNSLCRNPDGDSQPWCFINKNNRLKWNYCKIRKCAGGKTHTYTRRQRWKHACFLALFAFSASSSHPTNYLWDPSTAARQYWVLPVWEATTQPLSQDLRREEVCSGGSSLAGFSTDPVQGLLWVLQTHLWRHPDPVVLGAHCCPLHVRVLCGGLIWNGIWTLIWILLKKNGRGNASGAGRSGHREGWSTRSGYSGGASHRAWAVQGEPFCSS